MEVDTDIIDLYKPELLAGEVKQILEGPDVKLFKKALKPYYIISEAGKDRIMVTNMAYDKLIKKYNVQNKEVIYLKNKVDKMQQEINYLKGVMNKCNNCVYESGGLKKLKI